MNYKCFSFATALMLAAPSCFGVRTDLRSTAEAMGALQDSLVSVVGAMAASSGRLHAIEGQRVGAIGDATGIIMVDARDDEPALVARNKAALSDEDYSRLAQGAPAHEVIEAAQKMSRK